MTALAEQESTLTPAMLPPLWSHQREALRRIADIDPYLPKRFALFFDPGTGKTRTIIEVLNADDRYRKVIIFAPLNVCRNWINEIEKYSTKACEYHLLTGIKNKKLEILNGFSTSKCRNGTKACHQVLIANIEALRSGQYRFILKDSHADFIVCDESHNFKSHGSAQTKGMLELASALQPRDLYLLTGTPAPQGEIDLWSSFVLLGVCNDSFFIWRRKHFADKNERRRGQRNYWPEYSVTDKSREYLGRLLADNSLTAHKNEVLDLPPLLRTNIYAELTSEQLRHYDTMKGFLFAIDAEGHELNASNLLSRTLRLQQIVAGFLGDAPIACNRLLALKDAIELTNNGQFIIWTIFKSTYRAISKLLDEMKISFGMLTGDVDAANRQLTMDSFQSGGVRALIAHPKAGGVGVNLTAAAYSIHYTRNYNLVDDLQAEARNYRGGSEIHERITRIDVISPGTIDESIVEALREKKSVQDFILGLKKGKI